nr:MAG TPA: hypothetical protein [Caudoviricetes sp.]
MRKLTRVLRPFFEKDAVHLWEKMGESVSPCGF